MKELLAAMVATGVGTFGIAVTMQPLPEPAPQFEVRVVTYDGQLFIAGSGSDCVAAWQGARVPAGWQSIECVDATAPRFAFHF
ncbi:hypothetical protein EN780_03295 [Mesorhizobium sp. M4B.F.Ca.ET.089.01.1.1]|uniref:hypothetical protein n=1 Tax=Mesorhizobium sp. M4B.F.Ca.ET.089.01.1.1 TaxID=2496662 RepID=UPI000FE3371C|nr:hypothetical protein [Mesorhizobium sp. M4B.F.Ca.ET.089.01.1.1]RWX70433.1 hypothetical protein EN780_03295 [Mesorhizobium sp. M4B.F.Ca.ET.089.01.1.1]TIX43170.1 MAG: hypothetical protein E5V40_04305 [Mesorhizobium sp.]